jgi:hypothetical protein
MQHIVHRTSKHNRKPARLFYRGGITRDEIERVIDEIGREEVEAVLRALDLPLEPTLTRAK